METSQDPTSLITYNGSIYYMYVDTKRRMIVAKKTGDQIETFVAFTLTTDPSDIWHCGPTIGIDKKGYIHICGDMHNGTWNYYRSKYPEEINSWIKRTDLPGVGVTYTNMIYDNNRELFICFRHESNVPGKGNHRGGIIRYNAENDTFAMLGGTSYDDITGFSPKTPLPDSKPNTMFWGNGFGGNDCWYTKPGHRVFFDKNNRMHVISGLINKCIAAPLGYESNTHIIYAYSDDLGLTWHKAGGELISTLPLTVTNASIVLDRTAENDIYGGDCELGAFDSQHPIVSYMLSSDKSTHTLMWNGTAWSEIFPPHPTNVFMCRNNGYAAWYNGTFIDYTNDGITWKSISGLTPFPGGASVDMAGLDREYFKQTGNFRYHGKFNGFLTSSVFTIYSNVGIGVTAIDKTVNNTEKPTGKYKLYTVQGMLVGTFQGEKLDSVSLKQQGVSCGIYLAVSQNAFSLQRILRILI